ncbi:MFS transporter [Fervidicoccus fontis]|nr:MFS transporter [Fervidicoccus fontis]MBE9391608.1 MFS transporter [Fervidicoccus fontis]
MKIDKKIRVFLILSFVSLFADMTYEGARSVGGAYLEVLKAPLIFAGMLSIGELLAYLFRAFSGILVTKYRSSSFLWFLTITGYVTNLAVIPLLAISGNWIIAFILYMLERIGKGLRGPSRDIILSELIKGLGSGKGFGIHEFLDQLGAVSGPLIVAYYLAGHGGFYYAYLFLAIPATIAIALVFSAMIQYPKIESVHTDKRISFRVPRGTFRFFLVSIFLISVSFTQWGIISYRITLEGIGAQYAAILYVLAMAADAAVAIPLGMLFDKYGVKTIYPIPIISIFSNILLLFENSLFLLFLGSILWGTVTGYYESVFRAAVAELAKEDVAGGFGVYSLVQGIAMGIGGIIIAVFYIVSKSALIDYIIALNLIAMLFFALSTKRSI